MQKKKKMIGDWNGEGVEAAANFLRDWEGLRLVPYKAVPSETHWTVGYGHYSKDIREGERIDEIQAELFLDADIKYVQRQLADLVSVPVTLAQSTALLSFAFNVGIGNFKRSTLRKLLNEGKAVNAAYEFRKWNRAGGKELPGLSRRRRAEKALFMDGV